jgi:hypothetical protein
MREYDMNAGMGMGSLPARMDSAPTVTNPSKPHKPGGPGPAMSAKPGAKPALVNPNGAI